MDTKLLVTLRTPEEAQLVRQAGCEVLAEYPDSLLVRCTEAQQETLQQAGLEATELEQPAIRVAGASFAFDQALEADIAVPIIPDPNRVAYYLVKLIGPAKGEWLDAIRAQGGTIQSNLPGFSLLIGMLPAAVQKLQEQPWVEGVTPYRPAMKISPKLRPGASRDLSAADLATVELRRDESGPREQIEITVFPGESTASIAAHVRATGGLVLAENSRAVIAVVAPATIAELANEPGAQAILPHEFPELHNDRATVAMGAPADRTFGTLTLRGAGQIVGIADSGLDTGVLATVHADMNGRVVNIVSWPTNSVFAPYTNDPPSNDDGPADVNSGHGTHVTGSVLSNGAAALTAGSSTVPQGMAPEAEVYFQAIEQRVNWKTVAQLAASGLTPFTSPWPPAAASLWGLPTDLINLFTPAYAAGARIHTNSWGASVAGQYTSNSRAVDQFMWTHRDTLILFSAGNAGRDADTNGVIDVDSIGSPGTAKNCLTIGASENNRPAGSTPTPGIDANWNVLGGGVPKWPALGAAGHVSDNVDGMAAFSSRGPTDDGRLKPDLVAPGTNVLSTRSSAFLGSDPLWGDVAAGDPLHGLYCWSGGTSMSTPLVAGAAALIRQHLVQQRGHSQPGVKPSGALIKAFLVNGATPMAGQFAGEIPAGQNPVSGFGRVNLTESLTPGALQQTLFADEPDYAVETGQMRTFEVQVIDTTLPLKVTLVWTDAPSPAGVGGLQNQLYLQVRDPGGTVLNGDISAFPSVSNNVQQVVIAAPAAGTYEIRVRGVSVTQQAPGASGGPNPRQDFALAVSNAMGLSLQPVSIAQAIDTTGSMVFFGYMEPAKERATQLIDFMRINDKVSITEFSQRLGLPDARTVYSLRLLGSFTPDWTDAATAIAGLTSAGFTPIGAGLLEAWNQLHLEPASRPRAIVLLSDGLNNVPPDPLSVLSSIPADVPIFTIALGPAGSASTLQDIASSRPNGAYYTIETDEDIHRLHEIYAQVQALASGAALIGLSSAEVESQAEQQHELAVEPDVKEVTFALSWAESGHKIDFEVVGPDGQRYNSAAAATTERRGSTHHLVRVAVPKAGLWLLTVRNQGSPKPAKYTVSAAVRSPLMLTAETTRLEGERMALVARLRLGDKPWDEAKVVARMTMPTRSNQQVLAEFGDRIRQVQLPEALDEPGLDEEQRLVMKLAVFAQQFDPKDGGLYGRKSVEVELLPQGNGTWVTEMPIQVSGNITVEVVARGEIENLPWERYAIQSVQAPEPTTSGQRLRIEEIFARRSRLWNYTIIGARLLKADHTPATPADEAQVSMVVTQENQKAEADNLPYYRRGQYYIWRFKAAGFKPGGAMVKVQAKLDGTAAVTETKSIQL